MATRQALADAAGALAELDPVMAALIERHGPPRFGAKGATSARYESLARAVAYQQLAGNAAAAIWGRVKLLADDEHLTPARVLEVGEVPLRAAGLSGTKAASLLDLAAKTEDGTVRLDRLGRMKDEDVVAELTQVRGIGPWTAEMFLIFDLHRLDVWPVTDYGVQSGYAIAHGLTERPKPRELDGLGDRFRPYRSVAAWYCWRAVEG